MIYSRNKLESFEIMTKLNVNRTYSKTCLTKYDAYNFINEMKDRGYTTCGCRQSSVKGGGGKFFNSIDCNKAIEYVKSGEIPTPALIGESMFGKEERIIYQGEIQLLETGRLQGRICHVKGITNREALSGKHYVQELCHPDLNWGFYSVRPIVDYLIQYGMIGPVIEFSYYQMPVGIHQDPILIWEIRNY